MSANPTLCRMTIAEFEAEPNFAAMLDEYAAECKIAGMPECNYQSNTYHLLESTGLLHLVGVRVGETLAGFCVFLMHILPHYGVRVGVMESMFVTPKYRSSGAGLPLIRKVEEIAKDLGGVGLFMCAPVGGSMERVMPSLGYRHTNTVFFKAVA